MIDHDIMRLDISVHDALAVAEVQGLQQLKDVEANIVVGKPRVEGAEVGVVDIFKDQTRRFALTVPDHIQQGHHVGAACQVLQDLDLSLDLLLLDRLEDLDDTFLVVDDVDTFEDFRVLSTACGQTVSMRGPRPIIERMEMTALPILRTTS